MPTYQIKAVLEEVSGSGKTAPICLSVVSPHFIRCQLDDEDDVQDDGTFYIESEAAARDLFRQIAKD